MGAKMNQAIETILRKHGADPAEFSEASATGVWTGRVTGAKARELWLELREPFGQTGLWPVIRGEPGARDEGDVDSAGILGAVADDSPRRFMEFQLEEQRTFAVDVMGLEVPADVDVVGLARLLDASGAFEFGGQAKPPSPSPTEPPAAKKLEFASTRSAASRATFPVVELSLVALNHPYEAPAYLGFGGWNDCPAPEIQVAALRDWFERFGAVPAAMSGDVMECVVARPPQTEVASLQLAAEQWLFCGDIVSQGTMSVRRLALELWRQPKWFFWWD
jgi:hypothetical protein